MFLWVDGRGRSGCCESVMVGWTWICGSEEDWFAKVVVDEIVVILRSMVLQEEATSRT